MERIIIHEVDNTSNVESLSSYDIVYVPGFANGPTDADGKNVINTSLYRTPTFIRDKYEFSRLYGSTTPVFASAQGYPESFPDRAKKWGEEVGGYYSLTVNGFASIENAVDSGFYSQVTDTPSLFVVGTSYYSGEISNETLNLEYVGTADSEVDAELTASLNALLGKDYYTITPGDPVQGDFDPNITYYSKETAEGVTTYTPLAEPVSGCYNIGVTPFTGSTFLDDVEYFELVGNDYVTTSDETPIVGNGKLCFSSTTNPYTGGWYVKPSGSSEYQRVGNTETHINPSTTYYGYEDGVPNMFEVGDADPGYRYAFALLSMGIPIYYEQMNLSDSDITVSNMYAGLANRFTGSDPDPDYTFDSVGDFSVKFITSGGYPTFEYDSNAIASGMINIAAKREDSIALIDHTDNPERPLAAYDSDSVVSQVRNWSLGDGLGTYGAVFTPWYECSAPGVASTSDGTAIENHMMPASLAYLTSLAVQLKNYNPWLAVSGVTRGQVPFCTGLHTTRPLTNNIADSYQALPDESSEVTAISINPITYIRNYGYCIWGNRTLRNNASGTKASSFLNIRSAVSDIKKRLYEASQRLLFEQNTDVLWMNFQSLVNPLLETMVSDYIINDYAITRLFTDPQTGYAVPAYKVLAVIRIQPINSVEVFELTVFLENTDEFVLTTSEVVES